MSEQTLVYSDTAVTSADGEVSIGRHTSCIKILNLSASADAVVKLNGGPLSVLIPSTNTAPGYIEIFGDYTKFEVITSAVTVSVMAFG